MARQNRAARVVDETSAKGAAEAARTVCGIVMPISSLDGCDTSHWTDVRDILSEAIEDAGFAPQMVSTADEVGIIHKRILQNLYENEIVVCDVSGKNPNVMFELGLRLAFDKPTIIVKDDKTAYSFDTSPIEHIEYPRDLRFSKIVEFKSTLTEKVLATHAKATDPNYTTFLKHFGPFTVAKLEKKEVDAAEFIIEELRKLRQSVDSMKTPTRALSSGPNTNRINLCARGLPDSAIEKTSEFAMAQPGVVMLRVENRGTDHKHLIIDTTSLDETRWRELQRQLRRVLGPPKRIDDGDQNH